MAPEGLAPKLHFFDTVDSTNNKARELAADGGGEGIVVIAKSQTQGRGRHRRVWHSPEGGLYLSALLYPREKRRASDLSILAGAALAQSVKQLLPKSKDVTVKWPNDCLVGWKKVAGVLCEFLGEDYFNLCVVGIGINVNVADEELKKFQGNPFGATSFLGETGGQFPLDETAHIVVNKLFQLYRIYQTQGLAPIQYVWEKNCAFIGKKVELRESGWRDNPSYKEGEVGATQGKMEGIDESGAIVLSNTTGERHSYLSGEITCYWP